MTHLFPFYLPSSSLLQKPTSHLSNVQPHLYLRYASLYHALLRPSRRVGAKEDGEHTPMPVSRFQFRKPQGKQLRPAPDHHFNPTSPSHQPAFPHGSPPSTVMLHVGCILLCQ